jgi:hypothetical protein
MDESFSQKDESQQNHSEQQSIQENCTKQEEEEFDHEQLFALL